MLPLWPAARLASASSHTASTRTTRWSDVTRRSNVGPPSRRASRRCRPSPAPAPSPGWRLGVRAPLLEAPPREAEPVRSTSVAGPMASVPKRSRISSTAAAGVLPARLGRLVLLAQAAEGQLLARRRPEVAHAHAQQADALARSRPGRGAPRAAAAMPCPLSMGSGTVDDRVMVRKLAKRTFRVTVRPARPGARSRVATASAHAHDLAAELVCGRSGRGRRSARGRPTSAHGRRTTGRSSMPLASWWRWRPLACPSAPTSVASGNVRQLADGGDGQPLEPGQRGRSHPPQGLDGQRVQEGQLLARLHHHHARAGPHPGRRGSGLGRLRGQLGDHLHRWPRPTEQASASSSHTLAADRPRRSRAPSRTAGGRR